MNTTNDAAEAVAEALAIAGRLRRLATNPVLTRGQRADMIGKAAHLGDVARTIEGATAAQAEDRHAL